MLLETARPLPGTDSARTAIRLLCFAVLTLPAQRLGAQCPTKIQGECGTPDGDLAHCSFTLRTATSS